MSDAVPDFTVWTVAEQYAQSIKAGYNAYFFDRPADSCHYHHADERAAWLHGYNKARAHLLGLPD